MSDFSSRFCAARRACIARDFAKLNPEQRRGVLTTEGPLLLLAGAGSGKTTVLINRIANLLTYGRGSDCGEVPAGASEDDLAFLENYPAQPTADERRRMRQLCAVEPPAPWQVLAVTFTNKAAKELRERLEAFGIAGAGDIWALTFHSACVRILRRDIDKLGFSNDFTIYDTDDCKRVVKDILKEMDLDEKTFSPREVLAVISKAKDELLSPQDFSKKWAGSGDWKRERVAKIYARYDRILCEANALDFDDLILSHGAPAAKRARRCERTTGANSATSSSMSIRTRTRCSTSWCACLRTAIATSASSATTTRASISFRGADDRQHPEF